MLPHPKKTDYKGCPDIDSNYTVGHLLGQGTYGQVYEGTHKRSQQPVAIKQIKDYAFDAADAKRLYREMSLLGILKSHPHFVSLEYISTTRDDSDRDHLFFVFERFDSDLHRLIYNGPILHRAQINREQRELYLYQILSAIEYMHSKNLVHRDLKPGNILINQNGRVAICDLGLARAIEIKNKRDLTPQITRQLTGYVVTRWYRSPELVLECTGAGTPPTDMWSIGCILGEMLLQKPVFSANNSSDLFQQIGCLIGTDDPDNYTWINDVKVRGYVMNHLPKFPRMDFHRRFGPATAAEYDLLERIFIYNPTKRITANQALGHECFASLNHSSIAVPPIPEKTCMQQTSENEYYDFELELSSNQELPLERICQYIQKTIARYPAMDAQCGITDIELSDEKTTSATPPLFQTSSNSNSFFHPNQKSSSTVFSQLHRSLT